MQALPASAAPRRAAAVAVGKTARVATRRLGRGGGTTLPGLLALKLDPALLADLAADIPQGVLLVTGTNGKTTTSRMLAASLRTAGLAPVHNHEGSNLSRGLATTLVSRADLLGRLRVGDRGVGLFEVDEGALPEVLRRTRPRVLVFTNVFRDQLDRYFELDYVIHLWRQALGGLAPQTVLVLNADDPRVATLGAGLANPVLHFGLEDPQHGRPGVEHAADSARCPVCSTDLEYERSFYAHLGHWSCPKCGLARPEPAVRATSVQADGARGSRVALATPLGAEQLEIPLPGLYNAYNALAAVAGAVAAGLPLEATRAIEQVGAPFGRLERVQVGDRSAFLVLVKNPNGFNEVMRTLSADGAVHRFLFALNDQVADGRDVSWVWDVDFEAFRPAVRSAVVSGQRALDLALRLEYADWVGAGAGPGAVPLTIEPDVVGAFRTALAQGPPAEPLYVVSTYTALWALREWLRAEGHVAPLWE